MTVEEWKRKNPPIQRKPITNVDRIRAMSVEELAAWIAEHPAVVAFDENNPQHKAWLEWLEKEADA